MATFLKWKNFDQEPWVISTVRRPRPPPLGPPLKAAWRLSDRLRTFLIGPPRRTGVRTICSLASKKPSCKKRLFVLLFRRRPLKSGVFCSVEESHSSSYSPPAGRGPPLGAGLRSGAACRRYLPLYVIVVVVVLLSSSVLCSDFHPD